MSSSALPITPQRFAEAILDLPLPSLHLKGAEIRNSISHLQSSNSQLQLFADEGDKDCEDALKENENTMLRMKERIAMLKHEVERRGFEWMDDAPTERPANEEKSNGHAENQQRSGGGIASTHANGNNVGTQQHQNGGVREPEASPSTLLERIGSDIEEPEGGLHL